VAWTATAAATAVGSGDFHEKAVKSKFIGIWFFSWDFPYGLMPTNGVGDFRDFLPAPWICKSFFQSDLGFCPAQVVFRRHCWIQCHFSSGGKDTASVVAVVFM
jgi:hypothetical protein